MSTWINKSPAALTLILIGVLVLGPSAHTVYQFERESAVWRYLNRRYPSHPWDDLRLAVDGRAATVLGQSIRITDTAGESERYFGDVVEPTRSTVVSIFINGKDYTDPHPTVADRTQTDSFSRYRGLRTYQSRDEDLGEDFVAIIQELGSRKDAQPSMDGLRPMMFRLLLIYKDGRIIEDRFDQEHWDSPLIRYRFACEVTSGQRGCYSDVRAAYPTYLYPLFYPYVTAGMGAISVGSTSLTGEKG